MSDNILKTIQSILQDVIAPDIREIKAQQAAMQQQMDLRFKEVDTRFKAMEQQIEIQIGGLRQEIAIQVGGLRQELAIQVNGLNNNMAHLEKQLLSAYAASQLQVELTGTKAIVDIRERVAVLESNAPPSLLPSKNQLHRNLPFPPLIYHEKLAGRAESPPMKVQESPVAEFRNPNAGGSGGSQDNRSFLIMMLVMMGVIFGLQYWRSKHNPPPPDAQTASQPATQPAPASPATAAATAAQAQTAATVPAVVAAAVSSTTVENDLYRITFSNRGGQVTSWVLKKFKDTAGQPLDLVHAGAAAQFGYPLSLYTYDAALTQQLATGLYVASSTGTLTAPATLTFRYAQGNLDVTKTFTFGAGYVIHADSVVLRNGAPIRALLSWPSALGDMESATAYAAAQIDTSISGKDDHESFKKISGGATLAGPFDFAGTSDQYFAAIFLPDQPTDASVVTLHNQVDVLVDPRVGQHHAPAPANGKPTLVPVLGTAVGDLSGHNQVRLFVGPKSTDVLQSVHTATGGNLGPVLDFGFWGPVGKVLFLGLHAVHSILPNAAEATSAPHNFSWGWAIVVFTVLINLVLLPLRIKGMHSALKMQRIQPQIDAIKLKYKNPGATDPKAAEMNAEIMAYQKEQGVSMFGGCVPSLIQLPLLFAFFTMITRVVELRQAHWFWLPDLSLADPWHILPITMVITSFLVQFYTPAPGVDPQQQRMMAFMMPVFSGYWTWNYASGLALYWNVGNLINILTQLALNRTSLGREMREIAAKRAARKAAAAKAGPRGSNVRTIQGRR